MKKYICTEKEMIEDEEKIPQELMPVEKRVIETLASQGVKQAMREAGFRCGGKILVKNVYSCISDKDLPNYKKKKILAGRRLDLLLNNGPGLLVVIFIPMENRFADDEFVHLYMYCYDVRRELTRYPDDPGVIHDHFDSTFFQDTEVFCWDSFARELVDLIINFWKYRNMGITARPTKGR